jgi:hypothetical protein
MKTPKLTAETSLRGDRSGSIDPDAEWLPIPKPDQIESSPDRLTPSFVPAAEAVYAYGRVGARFPNLSLEKEFYQSLEIVAPRGPRGDFDVTDPVDVDILNQELSRTDLLYSVLSKPENIYIARDMVWVFQDLSGILEYVIVPESDDQVTRLVNALAPGRDGTPAALILIGDAASPSGGLRSIPAPRVRLVAIRTQLVPAPGGANPGDQTLFQQVQSLLINPGKRDGDRALNFVLLNHGDFYSTTRNLMQPVRGAQTAYGFNLSQAETSLREINQIELVDVIFTFVPEISGPQIQYYASVNVTSLFPFIVVPFTNYIPRKSSGCDIRISTASAKDPNPGTRVRQCGDNVFVYRFTP